MSVGVIVVIAVAVLLVLVVVRSRVNRSRDGVDSFRRQIDALSPEARRPVVDQVQNAAGRIEPRPVGETDDGGEPDDEDGARGA